MLAQRLTALTGGNSSTFAIRLEPALFLWCVCPPAHQRLVVLDQTHGPGGLLVLWQLVRHRRKDGAVVPLGHRVVG